MQEVHHLIQLLNQVTTEAPVTSTVHALYALVLLGEYQRSTETHNLLNVAQQKLESTSSPSIALVSQLAQCLCLSSPTQPPELLPTWMQQRLLTEGPPQPQENLQAELIAALTLLKDQYQAVKPERFIYAWPVDISFITPDGQRWIVEIDGPHHHDTRAKDKRRDAWFEKVLGIKVIRISTWPYMPKCADALKIIENSVSSAREIKRTEAKKSTILLKPKQATPVKPSHTSKSASTEIVKESADVEVTVRVSAISKKTEITQPDKALKKSRSKSEVKAPALPKVKKTLTLNEAIKAGDFDQFRVQFARKKLSETGELLLHRALQVYKKMSGHKKASLREVIKFLLEQTAIPALLKLNTSRPQNSFLLLEAGDCDADVMQLFSERLLPQPKNTGSVHTSREKKRSGTLSLTTQELMPALQTAFQVAKAVSCQVVTDLLGEKFKQLGQPLPISAQEVKQKDIKTADKDKKTVSILSPVTSISTDTSALIKQLSTPISSTTFLQNNQNEDKEEKNARSPGDKKSSFAMKHLVDKNVSNCLCCSCNPELTEPQQELQILYELACCHDALALFTLGSFYFRGYYVPKDDSQAFIYFKQAAVQGHPFAICNVASFYFTGLVGNMNKQHREIEAFQWYEKAALLGVSLAQFNMGAYYGCGDLGKKEKDVGKSIMWYQKAAEAGIAEANFKLAQHYEKQAEEGVEDAKSKAEKYYKAAVEATVKNPELSTIQADNEYQFLVGECYSEGKGVKQNTQTAIIWFLQAAETGHVKAQFRLALLYQKQNNYKETYKWLLKAAEANHVEAQFFLGVLYKEGLGTQENYEEAYRWFLKAAKANHAKAQDFVGALYLQGHRTNQNSQEVFNWFINAANSKDAMAQFIVGDYYEKGLVVKKDMEKALYWYQQSAQQQYHLALNKLKELSDICPEELFDETGHYSYFLE